MQPVHSDSYRDCMATLCKFATELHRRGQWDSDWRAFACKERSDIELRTGIHQRYKRGGVQNPVTVIQMGGEI